MRKQEKKRRRTRRRKRTRTRRRKTTRRRMKKARIFSHSLPSYPVCVLFFFDLVEDSFLFSMSAFTENKM